MQSYERHGMLQILLWIVPDAQNYTNLRRLTSVAVYRFVTIALHQYFIGTAIWLPNNRRHCSACISCQKFILYKSHK